MPSYLKHNPKTSRGYYRVITTWVAPLLIQSYLFLAYPSIHPLLIYTFYDTKFPWPISQCLHLSELTSHNARFLIEGLGLWCTIMVLVIRFLLGLGGSRYQNCDEQHSYFWRLGLHIGWFYNPRKPLKPQILIMEM